MAFYNKKVFWVLAAIFLISAYLAVGRKFERVGVKVYEVKKQDMVISVTATSTGTVKADQEVKFTARRAGTVRKLFVDEGSVVRKGDRIAELETDEVLQRLTIAAAALQRGTSTLQSLSLGLQAYKEEVESSISRAAAILNETESRLRKFNELMAKGYISQLDLEALQKEHAVAQANHVAALAAREQVKAREEEVRAQEAAVRQARNEQSLAQLQYDYSFITSSLDGVVTARPVKVGETVPAGALIATAVSPDSLYVEAFIDEADAAKVRIGQPVQVGYDAFAGRVFNGEVTMISPVVLGGKQEARTFEIRIRLAEREVAIKPGMSADIEVIIDRFRDVLGVPSQAVIERAEGRFVYAVRNERAKLIPITPGHFTWNFTEVTEGLGEGEQVITNLDAAGFGDGVRVKVLKSEK